MSFRKGDLLTKTRRLLKGNVIKKPLWFDAVARNPPQSVRVKDDKPPRLHFREDRLIQSYFARHPEAQCEAFELNSFEAPIARRYAWQVLELLDQGFSSDWARDIVEAELLAEEKAKYRKDLQDGRPTRKSMIEEVQNEEWANMANGLHNMEPTNRGRS